MKWIKVLKNWVVKRVYSKYADWWLATFSFGDSAFFPIPPDPILIGLAVFQSHRWRQLAFITVAASTAGAIFGYGLGYWSFDSILQPLVELYGFEDQVNQVGQDFADNAVLALLLAAFTPIPFKVFTIAAGLFKINFFTFIITSIIGRSMRFYLVSFLAAKFGLKAVELFKKHLKIATIIILTIVGAYLILY